MKTLRALLVLTLAPVLLLTTVQLTFAAEERALSEEQAARLEARFAEAREALQLTPEQEAALEPILRESADKRRAVFAEYGIDESRVTDGERLKLREMRALGKDMRAVQDETRDALAPVLSEEQLKTWEKLRKDYRNELKAQLKARGKS